MKSVPTLLLLAAALTMLLGCARRRVIVTDTAGNPVVGAQVKAIALSIHSGPVATNSAGKASLPHDVQETKWVDISAPGYQPVHLDAPKKWPLHVTLQPAAE